MVQIVAMLLRLAESLLMSLTAILPVLAIRPSHAVVPID